MTKNSYAILSKNDRFEFLTKLFDQDNYDRKTLDTKFPGFFNNWLKDILEKSPVLKTKNNNEIINSISENLYEFFVEIFRKVKFALFECNRLGRLVKLDKNFVEFEILDEATNEKTYYKIETSVSAITDLLNHPNLFERSSNIQLLGRTDNGILKVCFFY